MFRKLIVAPALLALAAGLTGPAAAQPPVKSIDVKLPPGAGNLNPDLGKLLKFNVTTTSVVVNEKVKRITVTVKNTGATPVAAVDVRATVKFSTPIVSPSVGFEETKKVLDLAPGQSKSVSYAFDMAAFRTQITQALLGEGVPTFAISGTADPANKIGETNEGDNVKEISLR